MLRVDDPAFEPGHMTIRADLETKVDLYADRIIVRRPKVCHDS